MKREIPISNQNRQIWADSLKGFLIILVIVDHAIMSVYEQQSWDVHMFNIIASFHMPAFMAISGYFSSANKPIHVLIKGRLLRLLLPWFVWSLLLVIIDYETRRELLELTPPYWFLWVLFWIFISFCIIKKIADLINIDDRILHLSYFAMLAFSMIVYKTSAFHFNLYAYYYLFFVIGNLIKRYDYRISNVCALTIIACIWGVMAWNWNMHSLTFAVPDLLKILPESILVLTYRIITAFLAIFFLFGFFPKYMNGHHLLNMKLSQIGKDTLGIYCLHSFFVGRVKDLLLLMFDNIPNSFLTLLTVAISLGISVCCIRFIKIFKYSSLLLLGER